LATATHHEEARETNDERRRVEREMKQSQGVARRKEGEVSAIESGREELMREKVSHSYEIYKFLFIIYQTKTKTKPKLTPNPNPTG